MAYTPDWEPLADALRRVVATGASEDEAKTDLCRAVADRKINVRVRIAATSYMRGLYTDGNVDVPAHLRPGDLDWMHSRPFAQWRIGPRLGEHYSWIGGWENRPIDLIELSTADVTEVLCRAAKHHDEHLRAAPKPKSGGGAKTRGIAEAISHLWPNGIPQGLIAKDRNKEIIAQLEAKGYSIPQAAERAIQRVLQKRRSK